MANTKYSYTVKVLDSKKETLYEGIPFLDVMLVKIPSAGKFTIDFHHENRLGFAKLLYLLDTARQYTGVKVITKPKDSKSWLDCCITKSEIPEVITVEFNDKNSAITFVYATWIAALVPGNWNKYPTESLAAFDRFLSFVQKNGVERLLTAGESGKPIPLKAKDKTLAIVITKVMESKNALVAIKAKPSTEVKKETEKPSTATKKETAKPSTTATAKKETSKPSTPATANAETSTTTTTETAS